MSELQDRLPPFPFEEAKQTIEADFGQPFEQLFASFDPVPVAAASIAQVHFAVDTDGRELAVKVLRPHVKAAFARDFAFMMWVAEVTEDAGRRACGA